MGYSGRLAIAAIAMALAVPSVALAQKPDEKSKRKARKLLKQGDQKLRKGDQLAQKDKPDLAREAYQDGLKLYQDAFDTYPQPQIYFPIAQAEERLGRWMDAYRHYTQLLEEAENLNDQVKQAVGARLSGVKKNLASISFAKVQPEGATITVDGSEIGTAPLSQPHWVEPGDHTFAIRADGYLPQEGTLSLVAGDTLDQEVTLEEVPTVGKPKHKKKIDKSEPERPEVSRLPLWIGLGATGALAAATTFTGVLAVKKHGTFTDELEDPDVREDARDAGRKLAFTTDALLLATLASGAFTAYYYYAIFRPKQERLEQEGAPTAADNALWITPYAESDGGGLAIGGLF